LLYGRKLRGPFQAEAVGDRGLYKEGGDDGVSSENGRLSSSGNAWARDRGERKSASKTPESKYEKYVAGEGRGRCMK